MGGRLWGAIMRVCSVFLVGILALAWPILAQAQSGPSTAIPEAQAGTSSPIAPSDPAALIKLWYQQDTECEGGVGDNQQIQTACTERDAYTAKLNAAGWCYGEPGDLAYQMAWHQCGDTDESSGNSSDTNQQSDEQQQFEATDLNVIPAPIMACLQSAFVNWVAHRTSDVDTIENCKVPSGTLSNAIAFMGERRLSGEPVDSPWTDAHCQSLVDAYTCEDQGVVVKFSN